MKHDWEYKKLGESCILTMGQSPSSDSYNSEGEGLPFFQGCSDFGLIHPTITTFCTAPTKIAQADDVLMSVRAPIGTLNIADVECCIGRGLASFRANNDGVSKFLYYVLKYSKDKLQSLGTGSTFKAIGKDSLRNFIIPVPPLPTQRAIVAELDTLNEILDKKRQQLKELDTLAQSIFYDMFGDPVENEKGWEVKRLEDYCEVSSSKRVLVEDVVESGIPFLRGTELTILNKVSSSKDVQFTMFITPEHYERVKAITGVPKKGDILIPSINSEGISWVVDTEDPFYFKDGRVIWVHVNHDAFSSKYLKYAISQVLKANYSVLTSGATFLELKLFIVRDLNIPIPPLTLQQSFAQKIEAIEKQKNLINASIKEVETLLNATMDKYFG